MTQQHMHQTVTLQQRVSCIVPVFGGSSLKDTWQASVPQKSLPALSLQRHPLSCKHPMHLQGCVQQFYSSKMYDVYAYIAYCAGIVRKSRFTPPAPVVPLNPALGLGSSQSSIGSNGKYIEELP